MIRLCQSVTATGYFGVRMRSELLCGAQCYRFSAGYALISRGTVTVYANRRFAPDELCEFLSFTGGAIVCNSIAAECLSLPERERAIIMKCEHGKPDNRFFSPAFPEYSRIYALFLQSGLKMPDYDSFLADTAVRRRTGGARIFVNSEYTAAAMTLYQDDTAAVIGAIAVAKQRKGIGSALLQSAVNSLGKTVYICRAPDRNEHFYIKNGFTAVEPLIIM